MVSWRRLDARPLTEFDGDSVDTSLGRSLDTSFQPNENRPTYVNYTVLISCSPSTAGEVVLRSDGSDPPTTEICRSRLGNGGNSAGVSVRIPLTHIVPPGHFVELETVDDSGSPSFTLSAQTETTL